MVRGRLGEKTSVLIAYPEALESGQLPIRKKGMSIWETGRNGVWELYDDKPVVVAYGSDAENVGMETARNYYPFVEDVMAMQKAPSVA